MWWFFFKFLVNCQHMPQSPKAARVQIYIIFYSNFFKRPKRPMSSFGCAILAFLVFEFFFLWSTSLETMKKKLPKKAEIFSIGFFFLFCEASQNLSLNRQLFFFIVSKGGPKEKKLKNQKSRKSAAKCAQRPFCAFPQMSTIYNYSNDLHW